MLVGDGVSESGHVLQTKRHVCKTRGRLLLLGPTAEKASKKKSTTVVAPRYANLKERPDYSSLDNVSAKIC